MHAMKNFKITKPDDWHVHFRDGAQLTRTVNDHAARFARALIMPNLSPPVTNLALAEAYHKRIQAALAENHQLGCQMTLYLTDKTTPAEIEAAGASDLIRACKLYPAGVTTGSEHGVNAIEALFPVFAAMQDAGLVLCIHGEVNDTAVDVFDREAVFIDTVLSQMVREFPALKIVLEHITTAEAASFVAAQASHVAATITPHHLCLNRNDLLGHGIRPHLFCLPILKRERHQQALLRAATSGDPRFFCGTDSAPHARTAKLSACGCAGIYSGYHAVEIYAQVFEQEQALDKLEAFLSHFGADFYGLPVNTETLTLVKKPWTVPETLDFADDVVVPLFAGQTLSWQIQK